MTMDGPDPGIVGKMFVKQYYTTMHKDAAQLHRFYLESSSFVHGGSEIGSEDPVIGQKNIHDKIEALALKQVHAKIKQVDSHATLGDGIVVQVTGELSISGRPMRAFVQTFVLAPESPKKYYVHNDIFRYQDEDLAESEVNDSTVDGESAPLMEDVEVMDNNGDYQGPPSLSSSEEGKMVANQEVVMFSTQAGADNTALGETEPEAVRPNDGWEMISYEEAASAQQNGMPETMEPPAAVDEYPMETGHVTNSVPVIEEQPMTETFSPQGKEQQHLSWASRLTNKPSQVTGSSQNRPLGSTTVSTSQALPQREPRPSRRTTGGGGGGSDFNKPPTTAPGNPIGSSGTAGNSTGPNKEFKKGSGNAFNHRDTPDACQIFVGGLPYQATEAEIREAFKEYEPIKDVRVNPKNFGFVIFESSEPVERIMKNKDGFSVRGKSLNIEPKKERASGPRGPGGFRGGGDKFRGGMAGKPRGGGNMGGASGRNSKR